MKKSLNLVDKSRISSKNLLRIKYDPKPKAQYSFGRNISFLYTSMLTKIIVKMQWEK